MEIIKIAEQIEGKIGLLRDHRKTLVEKGKRKAETSAAYDKAVAICMLNLRHGKTYEIDGVSTPPDVPISIIEKIAKGICYKERLAMEVADNDYKSTVVAMDSLQAEINGYQSLNRHLSEV